MAFIPTALPSAPHAPALRPCRLRRRAPSAARRSATVVASASASSSASASAPARPARGMSPSAPASAPVSARILSVVSLALTGLLVALVVPQAALQAAQAGVVQRRVVGAVAVCVGVLQAWGWGRGRGSAKGREVGEGDRVMQAALVAGLAAGAAGKRRVRREEDEIGKVLEEIRERIGRVEREGRERAGEEDERVGLLREEVGWARGESERARAAEERARERVVEMVGRAERAEAAVREAEGRVRWAEERERVARDEGERLRGVVEGLREEREMWGREREMERAGEREMERAREREREDEMEARAERERRADRERRVDRERDRDRGSVVEGGLRSARGILAGIGRKEEGGKDGDWSLFGGDRRRGDASGYADYDLWKAPKKVEGTDADRPMSWPEIALGAGTVARQNETTAPQPPADAGSLGIPADGGFGGRGLDGGGRGRDGGGKVLQAGRNGVLDGAGSEQEPSERGETDGDGVDRMFAFSRTEFSEQPKSADDTVVASNGSADVNGAGAAISGLDVESFGPSEVGDTGEGISAGGVDSALEEPALDSYLDSLSSPAAMASEGNVTDAGRAIVESEAEVGQSYLSSLNSSGASDDSESVLSDDGSETSVFDSPSTTVSASPADSNSVAAGDDDDSSESAPPSSSPETSGDGLGEVESSDVPSSSPDTPASSPSEVVVEVSDSGNGEEAEPNSLASAQVLSREANVAELCGEAKTLVTKAKRSAAGSEKGCAMFSEAIDKLRVALDASNGSQVVLSQYGQALLSWGKSDLKCEMAADRLEEASRSLGLAIDLSPTDSTSLFNRGLCVCLIAAAQTSLDGNGEELYAEACRMYDKLLAVKPSSRVGAFNCGLAYVSRARLAEGSDPSSGDVIGFYRQAEDRFRMALEMRPEDEKAKAYLAECQSAIRSKSSSPLL